MKCDRLELRARKGKKKKNKKMTLELIRYDTLKIPNEHTPMNIFTPIISFIMQGMSLPMGSATTLPEKSTNTH